MPLRTPRQAWGPQGMGGVPMHAEGGLDGGPSNLHSQTTAHVLVVVPQDTLGPAAAAPHPAPPSAPTAPIAPRGGGGGSGACAQDSALPWSLPTAQSPPRAPVGLVLPAQLSPWTWTSLILGTPACPIPASPARPPAPPQPAFSAPARPPAPTELR